MWQARVRTIAARVLDVLLLLYDAVPRQNCRSLMILWPLLVLRVQLRPVREGRAETGSRGVCGGRLADLFATSRVSVEWCLGSRQWDSFAKFTSDGSPRGDSDLRAASTTSANGSSKVRRSKPAGSASCSGMCVGVRDSQPPCEPDVRSGLPSRTTAPSGRSRALAVEAAAIKPRWAPLPSRCHAAGRSRAKKSPSCSTSRFKARICR